MENNFVEIGRIRLTGAAGRKGAFLSYFKADLAQLLEAKENQEMVFYKSPQGEIRAKIVEPEKST